jgi:DNA-binding LacI/PurR family transcriptional regulator
VTNTGGTGRHAPTLEQVAARAGVSRATASRVLRGAVNVSEASRTAVLDAAQAISYAPNLAARSLVTGRSDSIAFLIAETEDRLFSDPFFLGLLRGAHAVAAAAQLQVVFTVAGTPEDSRRFVQYAGGGHVDGVLLLSLHGDSHLPQELEARGVPTVLAGRPMSGADELYYVDSDNVGGGVIATTHLLSSGRNRVATIKGPMDMSVGQDRFAGYRSAMTELGPGFDPALVADGDFTAAGGYAAMMRLLEAEPTLDAVFAASDLMALGAIRAIQACGRRVFDDVAVVGFDDIDEAALANPALTTVRQPIAGLGRTMCEHLLDRIKGPPPARFTVLPVELILRASG